MKKEYKTTDGNKIRKIGREKKIYFSENPYFIWNGTRYHFEEIPHVSYPIMYEDENGESGGVIGGYIGITNLYGVLVELIEGGEAVQLWEEIDR